MHVQVNERSATMQVVDSAYGGLRILDFTQGIAGPLACMLLADLGAEVIKIEPPAGDRARACPGYLFWNRNKRRLILNVTAYEGLRQVRGLVESADVVVFDSKPGELERLGLDGATLVDKHPALLHLWLPPFADKGRWSQLPASDSLLSALSGVSHMQSGSDQRPVHLVMPQVSYGHALIAATALAAGLYERERSGKGQSITVSGLEAVAALKTGAAIRASGVQADAASERGAGIRYGPNYRMYRCADGERLFLGCLTERFYTRALELLGLSELFNMPGVDRDFMKVHEPPMNAIAVARLEARFDEQPRAEWLRILHDPMVPLTPVDGAHAWFHGETVAANGMHLELQHPELGRVEMPGIPVAFSRTPGRVGHALLPVTLDDLPPHAPTAGGDGPVSSTASKGTGPLAGIRVLDVATFIAGSLAPAILASFGAEVVKIEPPDGDPWRTQGLGFIPWNRGKRGLVLDLKRIDGQEAFYDLVRRSDIVSDNFRVGVRDRLGISYERLAAINSHIITCSSTAYGPTGLLAQEPGFDTVLQARSGIAVTQGGEDEPVTLRMSPIDSVTAIMGAFGAIVALYVRERTGYGQEVWTSLANLTVLCQSNELVCYDGRLQNALGSADCVGISALNRFYRCIDGWIALECTSDRHYTNLCAALHHQEWSSEIRAEDALTAPRDGRLADRISGSVGNLTVDDVIDRLSTCDVPVAPAVTHDRIFTNPFLQENGFFDSYVHPDYGAVQGVRQYARWGRTPGGFARRAPLLGEHTIEVLRDFGFAESRIASLLVDGTAVQRPISTAVGAATGRESEAMP